MAEVWAKSNGNWTTASLWAFWNEATQQIEDYGQVPQDDDYVYANSYIISVNNGFSFVGTFTNKLNPYTQQIGGEVRISEGTLYIKNIECGNGVVVMVHPYSYGQGCNINFQNAYAYSQYHNLVLNDAGGLTINGNVYADDEITIGAYATYAVTFNGNVYSTNGAELNWGGGALTLNGNFVNIYGNINKALTLNGEFTIAVNRWLSTRTQSNITGRVFYSGNGCFDLNYFNILNPDTFTCKDISEPRSNPFIIVTDADMNNHQQYPPEDEVKQGTEYVWGEKVGTYTPDYPPESVVLKDYEYGDSDDRKTGTMEQEVNVEVGCVTPEDVRKDVPLVGMGVVGSLVVPSADDVREGVIFDNGSVGTLIVQGGGDRLRIADFGYYTRSTSITYIVDLTESDKPAFADCEEIVLRSLFPTLDLDNIPGKFFDDLFIQFLRYRLLVEYYRGTSINSKFTPSEPTAEIVNYANTKCEYWLNTANLFLQLWGEKYPNSVKKDRILL